MNFLGVAPETWFPVITLIVGVLLKAIFDAATDRRSALREREARRERRLDALRLKRVEFQRVTLLELQDLISQLARITGHSHVLDVAAHRTTGVWQKQKLPEGVNDGFQKAQIGVSRLRVRVRDEKTRQLAEAFSTVCVDAIYSANETAAENVLQKIPSMLAEVHERIGLVLRTLDDDEDRIVDKP